MIDGFIQEHGKRLYGLCLTLCADPCDASDLYQDTWLRALKNLEKYDKSRPFEPWLTRICVNLYKNARRRFYRSPVYDGFSSTEQKDAALAAVRAPEAGDYAPLRAAIARLPEKLRLAVITFYFCDMGLKGTAAALGIPAGTVKSRLSKAKLLLKEALRDEDDLPF